MKKTFIIGFAALTTSMTLTNCSKEPVAGPVGAGVPFEIHMPAAETKTTIDGLATKWAAKDSIILFHAESGSTEYTNDGKFLTSEEDMGAGRFTGTLASGLQEGKNYDWYALYPYNSSIATPAELSSSKKYNAYIGSRTDKSQSQAGKNSTAHLAGFGHPLYGKTASPTTGMATPSITMKPAFSVVKVNVTNKTDTDLAVSSIAFTAPESVVGTFFIDFSGTEATYGDGQYVSSTAKLSVSGDATIVPNASADFYLAVKPFTATGGSTLKISVNGYEKSLTTTTPVTFAEGKVKKVNFSYDKTQVSATFRKITSSTDLTDGQYLIVYETDSCVFNSSLLKLDAASNFSTVTISASNTISTLEGYAFTFSKSGDNWTIKSSSGQYIGKTANRNGLDAEETVLTNTISFDDGGNCNIVGSGGAYLRYNSAKNQTRFRYFKSTTYTGQKAIQLYKRAD